MFPKRTTKCAISPHREYPVGMTRCLALCSTLVLVALFAGCVQEEVIETGPPEGWQAEEAQWWRTGFDTTGVFRDLETLASMGVTGAEATYVASPTMVRQRANQRQMFERAVKQQLIRLYRNQPEVVDSLVERHVVPMLAEVDLDANMKTEVERLKRKSYQFLHRNYFQAPQQELQVGRDIEVPYPDDLRKRQVAGVVQVQIYVSEEGEPLAIELIGSVDPDLDGIAMRTMTKMRWRPAYLMGKSNWSTIPAWTRVKIRFGG